jgi:hypothetical protein
MDTLITPTIWSKQNPAWGQRRRIQRNAYAFRVSMRMTSGELMCPTCHGPFDLDTAEVDKAIPALDYTPSNIAYICRGCNQDRSRLQSIGRDWTYAATYAADVRHASVGVAIPTEAEARQWHDSRPTIQVFPRYA